MTSPTSRPEYELDGRSYNFVAIDVIGAPARIDPVLADIEQAAQADGSFTVIRDELTPIRIRDLDRVRVVPTAMAAVLTLVAVAALGHLLLTSVRERRRDLALLRTLGFSHRQLRAAVGWQASLMAAAALAIGVPLGVVLGRAVWHAFASNLHVFAPPETPWIWLVVVVVTTIVLANLVAAIPGRSAARTPSERHPARGVATGQVVWLQFVQPGWMPGVATGSEGSGYRWRSHSAMRSATMMVGRFVLAEGMVGMIEASAT